MIRALSRKMRRITKETPLDLLTKHFAVLSLAVTIYAAACSVAFINGYLAIFDWSLIWLIDSSKIFSFSLIFIGIFSTPIAIISFVSAITIQFRNKIINNTELIIYLFIFIIALFTILIIFTTKNSIYIFSFYTCLLVTIILVLLIFFCFLFTGPNLSYLYALFYIVFFIGLTCGSWVNDFSKPDQHFILKEANYRPSVINNAVTVFATSKYQIAKSGASILKIPVDDILEIIKF